MMVIMMVINEDTSDLLMRNDKAVNCLTGTVKMTKS